MLNHGQQFNLRHEVHLVDSNCEYSVDPVGWKRQIVLWWLAEALERSTSFSAKRMVRAPKPCGIRFSSGSELEGGALGGRKMIHLVL